MWYIPKTLSKFLLRHKLVNDGLCAIAAAYISVVRSTGRWEVVGGEVPYRLWERNQPFVLAFWHGRLLMMPCCWSRSMAMNMLISPHKDGQLIAHTVSYFGIRTVSGSSSRSGSTAFRIMFRALKAGECVGITPDGPHGPCMRVSNGIVKLARLAGVPVIPVSFSTNRSLMLKSWDRFLIALPFSHGVFVWGQPILVPKKADATTQEIYRKKIEQALNIVTIEADNRVGKSLYFK